MRLHADKITWRDLHDAARFAEGAGHGEITLERSESHGSRSKAFAWDVILEGDGSHSKRKRNAGTSRTADRWNMGYAATYDSWGWFFAYLFEVDPEMTCYAYSDALDFHSKTESKYVQAAFKAKALIEEKAW